MRDKELRKRYNKQYYKLHNKELRAKFKKRYYMKSKKECRYCSKPHRKNRSTCTYHGKICSEYNLDRMSILQARGLCTRCGKHELITTRHCTTCRDKWNLYLKRRRALVNIKSANRNSFN